MATSYGTGWVCVKCGFEFVSTIDEDEADATIDYGSPGDQTSPEADSAPVEATPQKNPMVPPDPMSGDSDPWSSTTESHHGSTPSSTKSVETGYKGKYVDFLKDSPTPPGNWDEYYASNMKETVRPTPGGRLGNPKDWTPKLHATRKPNKMPMNSPEPSTSQDLPEPPFLTASPIAADWIGGKSSPGEGSSTSLFGENKFDVSFTSPTKGGADSSQSE